MILEINKAEQQDITPAEIEWRDECRDARQWVRDTLVPALQKHGGVMPMRDIRKMSPPPMAVDQMQRMWATLEVVEERRLWDDSKTRTIRKMVYLKNLRHEYDPRRIRRLADRWMEIERKQK